MDNDAPATPDGPDLSAERAWGGASRREALGLIAATAGLAGAANVAASAAPGSLSADRLRVDRRALATGVVNPTPRFSWNLVALDPHRRDLTQTACQVRLAEAGAGGAVVFDSGRAHSADMALIPAASLNLAPQTPYVWRVRVWDQDGAVSAWSAPEPLVTGVDGAWRGAWIAAQPDGAITGPAGGPDGTPAPDYLLPLLRAAFTLDKPVRHAVLCLSGLGSYALSLNGASADQAVMNPGWTAYDKTVLYNTLDVTGQLRPGVNVLGVRLGGGMYDIQSRPGRYSKFVGSYGAPKLIAQLRIAHTDGSETWVVSGPDWRTHPGPTTFSSIYGGEDEDARLEPTGWTQSATAAQDWAPALATKGPGGALRPQATPGLKAFERFKPIAVTQPAPGVFVYDLGQNLAGRPVLSVRGPAGATVRIKPGELLGPDGRPDQTSMTGGAGADITFNYTLGDAKGAQVWRPRFRYTGFRYLQVEGAAPAGRGEGGTEILDLHAEVLHADLGSVGDFSCGDDLLTRTHGLIRRAVLSNSATVLTDCPHREKLGWLEQTYLNAATVFYNLDALPLYAKTAADIADSQRPNGMVPSIAPELVRFVDDAGHDTAFRDSPEWGSAAIQSPWAAFRFTGDAALLERSYPVMRRYADYLASRAKGGLLDFGLGDWYDRGPAPPGPAQLTSRAFTATAIWFADLTVLAQIADRLNRPDEAQALKAQAETVKAAINARFYDPGTRRYDRGSQTASAMALALQLAPPEARAAVLRALIDDIHGRGDHVSAGDIGFHYVVRALSEAHRGDVLFAMLSRTDAPSYGAQLRAGATALTEAWDANPHSSQNHFMLGHAEAWLFGGLGGIDIDFARGADDAVLIAPQPVAAVGQAQVRYVSALGEIRSSWRIAKGRFELQTEIPPGVRARVRVPCAEPARIYEGPTPITQTPRRFSVQVVGEVAEIRVGSGFYAFSAPAPGA